MHLLLGTWKVQQASKNRLFKFTCSVILTAMLPCSVAFSTTYLSPGNAVAPQTLDTGDTFTNITGLFQSTGTEVSAFGTVQVNSGSSGNTISINGGTVTATGTSTGAVATIPLYGATTSSTAINLAPGGTIAQNTAQASTVAMDFEGPIVFTKTGGTVTGSITAAGGSTITQTVGAITGDVTLGAASTVTLSTPITGALTIGAGSTLALSGTATVTGILTGNQSTMNFTTGITPPSNTVTGISTLNVNSGTFNLSGATAYAVSNAINVASGASLTFSSSMAASSASVVNAGTFVGSAVGAWPAGSIYNTGSLSLSPTQSFSNSITNLGSFTTAGSTLTSNGTVISTGALVGGGTFNNAGLFSYGGGTLTTTFNNSGILNISQSFTATAFTNTSTGYIYIFGPAPGALNHAVTAGNKITFGADSDDTISTGTFATHGTIANVPIINVESGSSLSVAHAISGVSNSFNVRDGAIATFSAAVAGAGLFNNEGGTVTVSTANAINMTSFSNTGDFNIASGGSFVTGTYSSLINTGNIYLSNGGTLTSNVVTSINGTLNVGRNSAGTTSVANFTAASAFTIPSINVYSTSSLTGTAAITANVYLTGTHTNPLSGTVLGSMLTIGMDSFGNQFTPTVTLTSALSTFPALYVTKGTLTTSGAGAISNLNSALFISSGATFNAGAAVSGGAVAGSNGGTLNLTSTFTFTTFSNAIGGVFNFNNGASIAASTTINNYSSGNGVVEGINIATTSTNAGTINNYGTIALNGTLSGAGTISNKSGATLDFNTNASNANPITNLSGGTFNINTSATNTAAIVNYGTMLLSSSTLSGAGSITNKDGGEFNWYSSTNSSHTITNDFGGTINFTGTSLNSGTFNNSGTVNLSAVLNGAGATANLVTGVMNISDGTLVAATTNTGTINVTGTTNGFIQFTNNGGEINISAPLLGGVIFNTSGTLNLNATAELDGTVNSTGTINVNADFVSAERINNNAAGILNIYADMEMNGALVSVASAATSTTTISGNRTITSVADPSFATAGVYNTTITSQSEYDSLSANNSLDFTNATFNITPYITNTNGEIWSFTIAEGSGVTPPVGGYNGIDSDFYRIIEVEELADRIVVHVNAEQVTVPINVEIAGVLQNMFAGTTNSGQQTLENAFLSIDRELNDSLHLMIPISNAFVYDAKMQGVVYNKIETRLAGLRDGWDSGVIHKGINAGDICPGGAAWFSVSGSLTEQGPDDEDDGYNAKTGVGLVGVDFSNGNNVLGFAGGYSYTHLKELSNENFIDNISRWHVMGYGSYNFKCCNYWDWLVTTNFNNNNAHRNINVSGSNMTVYSKYHAYQLAGKLTRGKGFDFLDSYKFTPFTFVQYAFIHQDGYNETGSVAALSVQSINKNILTLGLGAKFDFPLDAWQCIGMRELRAAVVYDVINNQNDTTANFVVGSNSFTVTSTPVRLGLQLGAGIAFEFADHLVFELNYDFEVRSHFTDNTGQIKFKYVF